MFDKTIIGKRTGYRTLEYTWRDIILYNLGVGAKAEDLHYTYEKYLKTVPAYGAVPYWGNINMTPAAPMPMNAGVQFVPDYLGATGGLHMEHEIIIHKPIDPMGGKLIFQDVITDLYDRGEGKGAVLKTRMEVYDGAGVPVCTNISSTVYFTGGGFGGEKPPKSEVDIPEREPDMTVSEHLPATANLLYRLSGDTNLVHVDPEICRYAGQKKPFMQGLCSFGYACRMAGDLLFPGQPERMKRMAAQMRNVVFPDSDLTLQLWKTGDNSAVFRLVSGEEMSPVLDRGVIEWA